MAKCLVLQIHRSSFNRHVQTFMQKKRLADSEGEGKHTNWNCEEGQIPQGYIEDIFARRNDCVHKL